MRKFLNLKSPLHDCKGEAPPEDLLLNSARAKISIEDKKNIQSVDKRAQNQHANLEDRVRRLILCKGQMFGEDECLKLIVDFSAANADMPLDMNYAVTCESNDAELLEANVDDVYKLFKNESKVVKFMKEQYIQKFPSQKPADDFFKGVFSGKPIRAGDEPATKQAPESEYNQVNKKVNEIVNEAK